MAGVDVVSVAVIALAVVAAAIAVLAAVRGGAEQRALRPLASAPLLGPLTVIMPARNEGARIGNTLRALLREPAPGLRVIVVDDRSDDDTAAVVAAIADPRLSLVSLASDPPPGVFGKPRALAEGVRAAAAAGALGDAVGRVVVVVDADVHVDVGALGGLVAAQRARGAAALSVLPALDNRSAVEELLVPVFVAAVGGLFPPSAIAAQRTPFLNGQCFVVDVDALAAVGGFEAVSGTVLEDVALARALVGAGHVVDVVDGRAAVRTRMYESFAAMRAGFGKNARALFGPRLVPLALLFLFMATAPIVAVAVAAVTAGVVDDVVAVVAGAVVAGMSAQNRLRLGSRPWFGLLWPLAQGTVGLTYLGAAFSTRGQWRGRTFSTAPSATHATTPSTAPSTAPSTMHATMKPPASTPTGPST